MRIAIDARLNAYRQGGIPQYTRQLITALADVATEHQIVSFQHRDQLRPLAIAPNVARRTALTPPHHRFEQWTLPLEVLLARPDVLHCPDFIAPTRRSCPAVVTIHDLAFMHYPEILDASARTYYSQVTSNAQRADAIIAVSESTRQDIAQFLDIPIEQIDVIYEAAAPLYTRLDLREGEARVLNSTPVAAGTFMLFVSTLEPRKNLPTLLQALRICIDRRPDAGYRLVIVGRRGWRDDAIFQTARDLKLADQVLFTGGVGQYDLRWLYNACRLYINPSLYEGFGLPLLEAMACGAPCLAAATSSLPEIGGDAAIYVPPLEAEQWADEIMALWDDEDRRAELGRMGVARAQQFSWNRAARETLKVYRRAAERIVPRAEPLPSARHVQPLPELSPAIDLAQLGPDAPRPCLRCGTGLQPGALQLSISMQATHSEHSGPHVAPRIWACPRCGYVELVDETYLAAHHEHAAAGEDLSAQSLVAPVMPEADSVALDEPAAFDDQPVPSAVAPDAPDIAQLAEPVPGESDAMILEDMSDESEPAGNSAASDGVDRVQAATPGADAPNEPVVSEPDAAVFEDISDVASAASADIEPVEEQIALEAGAITSADASDTATDSASAAVQEQPEGFSVGEGGDHESPLPDAPALPDASTSAIATGPVHDAHPPTSSNGTAPKPKPSRRSRGQQSAADSTAKPAAKRRSSGSKRKQVN
jgi:glycosyltransferase involved in cell wall biosynthesis